MNTIEGLFDMNDTPGGNDQAQPGQPRTSDDITNEHRSAFDEENMGESTSIGNENAEEDGGADLGFGETDETEDIDRDSPLRREPGGSSSDGTNEGDFPGGKRNAGGLIGNLGKQYDTNTSSADGSGTMRE